MPQEVNIVFLFSHLSFIIITIALMFVKNLSVHAFNELKWN